MSACVLFLSSRGSGFAGVGDAYMALAVVVLGGIATLTLLFVAAVRAERPVWAYAVALAAFAVFVGVASTPFG